MSCVWSYFDRDGKEKARCRKCPKLLSCKGSSTSALLNHIRNVHNINVSSNSNNNEGEEADRSATKNESFPLLRYVSQKESIGEIFARCVAEDGLSVRALKRSKVVLAYLHSKNLNMPASETTIWQKIYEFFELKQMELKNHLIKLKETNHRFSIVVDEWSDISYTKYVNITVRSFDPEKKPLMYIT